MTRALITLAVVLGLASLAKAQDMPLSQILIEGEGWKKVEGKPEKPKGIDFGPLLGDFYVEAETYSPDRGTIFLAVPGQRFLLAAQAGTDGNVASLAVPYAPLRTRRGEMAISVTGLATDKDGRIYAASEIGVQVFDPTGRLCGVLTPAAAGKPEFFAFEGDELTLWIGDIKYTRKLNTTGAK